MELSLKSRACRSGRPKVLVVVGKATLKKASARNLLKRRLRALLARQALANRTDLTIYIKGRAGKIGFSELKERLAGAFKKHGSDF